jgi:hypothetical protein
MVQLDHPILSEHVIFWSFDQNTMHSIRKLKKLMFEAQAMLSKLLSLEVGQHFA